MSCGSAGYSGKVAEEIGQLKRLARRVEDRQRLGTLMEHITEKTATTVVEQPAPTPKVPCLSPLYNHDYIE